MAASDLQTDTHLVEQASAGDREAFSELVRRHQDFVYGVIQRLVSDRDRAADLTQETFLRAWRGLHHFSGGAAFSTWLYRIARNVVISGARYDAARPKIRASLDDEDNKVGVGLAAEDEGPGTHAHREETRELVRAAIETLGQEQREVVVLRDLVGKSYEEISELVGVPVGTVRSRLHRARRELKRELERLIEGPDGEHAA